jgi:DHA2 family methylenomycin A resistance protein-like MFS transporter
METITTRPERTAPTGRWPLVAVCLGYFMVILDVTVVTVANPTIGHDLRTSITTLQWVVDGYTMVFAGLLLLAGGLGDRFGARRVFLAGLIVFTAASAACAAAPGPVGLVVARLVQGAGAALLVPASLSLLHASYPDAAARARAIGVWGMMGGLAAAAGPVLGGVLVAGLGWRSIFLVNLPVAAAAYLLTTRTVPRHTDPRPAGNPGPTTDRAAGDPGPTGGRPAGGLDLPAQLVAVVMLAAVTGGLIQAGALGWASPLVLAALALGAAALVGFVLLERRSAAPMLPLRLFRMPAFSASVVVGVLLNLGFYGLLFVAPLYFEQVRHTGVLLTGLSILPMSAVVAASSALAGRVTARTGPRLPMVVGLLVGAAGLAGWLLAAPATPYLVLVVPMVAAGFGISFAMPASTTAIMRTAEAGRAGITSAVFNTARQLGSALGVAAYGTLAASGLLLGVHGGAILGAAGYLLATLCTVLFIPA